MPLGMSGKNQEGFKLRGTHQLLAYADVLNLLIDNIDNVNKTQEF
jgi:hypothetical protein